MPKKKEVRLSDIAKKLNISTVTVSKALSNKDGVGEDLRKEIKMMAMEMGYRQKKTPATHNENSTGNIGIIIPARFFSPNYSFYWHIFNQLSKTLLEKDYYSIMELISDQDEAELKIPRVISDGKVDGIIFLGQMNAQFIANVNKHYKNFVLLDFYINNSEYDCVINDDFYNSYMMTSYVINCGHKNIRFVGNFNATTSISDRYMGFQKAMYENGFDSKLSKILPDRDENGMQTTIPLPHKNEMPTAFICNSDLTAANLIHQLENEGYRIPEDISVTGYDNFISENEKIVPLTTVFINPEDTAETTADLLIKKISGEKYIPGRHLVSGCIIKRESVKNLKD